MNKIIRSEFRTRLWAYARSPNHGESEMTMNLRTVVEAVRHYFSRQLLYNPIRSKPAPIIRDAHKLSKVDACSSGAEVAVSSGAVRLASRLRPITARFFEGLFRRVSAPLWADARRRATKRLVFGENAPFFALIGITLVYNESERGILTKDDEIENLCGNIRDAISRIGWLHDPETWNSFKEKSAPAAADTQENESEIVPCRLSDLRLGPALGQGCHAAVYAAAWRNNDVTGDKHMHQSTTTTEGSNGTLEEANSSNPNNLDTSKGTSLAEDDDDDLSLTESLQEILNKPFAKSSVSLSDFSNSQLSERFSPAYSTYDVSLAGSRDFTATKISRKTKSDLEIPLLARHSEKNADLILHKRLTDSLGAVGGIEKMRRRKSRSASTAAPNMNGESIQESDEDVFDPCKESGICVSEFPFAVKMMFNYEAASNAPDILKAMECELLPAQAMQLDPLLEDWAYKFASEKSILPRHPCIVDMPLVFVDQVPLLKDSLERYPVALPTRLNPDGAGRNMSLFCIMKRYDLSLKEYLERNKDFPSNPHTGLLILTQLLEAVKHLHQSGVSHRDLKSDNILLSISEGWHYPRLVVTDFGCCLADPDGSLSVPFTSKHADPRQGNTALMAPEVKTATPGFLKYISWDKSDLWTVGALAFEIFGLRNPFILMHSRQIQQQQYLDSATYREGQLPQLPKSVPASVRRLVADLLKRNPKQRPSPEIAATLCQLALWGPSKWLSRHTLTLPSHKEVMQWLLCLTTKVVCEARLGCPSSLGCNCGRRSSGGLSNDGSTPSGAATGDGGLEYELVSMFLARVQYQHIIQAIKWNRAFF